MSNFLAIATVTAALRQTIFHAVQSAVTGTEVTTRRPDDPTGTDGNPRVNLYLYGVVPNTAWRNADLPTRRSDGTLVQRPQAALNLHYLLTFYGDEAQLHPQRLLGSLVSTLHVRPLLTRETIRRLIQTNQEEDDAYHFLTTSDLTEQVERVRFVPLSLNLEELSKLWSVFFQTPYTLSVAYQASVVLIEGEEEAPQAALPVRRPSLYTVSFRQPVIEQVMSAEGANQPIVAGNSLVIRGQCLRGDVTKVRIAGIEAMPQMVSEEQVRLQLSSLPADSLRAGAQGVQIVHKMLMGTPPEPHRGVESNVAAFVLRSTIANVVAPDATRVAVTLNPQVGKTQRVVLLLNEFDPPADRAPRAYSFKAPLDNGIEDEDVDETASITFPVSNVEPGDYLMRVQVDGAESPLEVDPVPDNPRYIGPMVTIP